jgi:hypothetical protein
MSKKGVNKKRLLEIKKDIINELKTECKKVEKDINYHYVGKDTNLLLYSYQKDLLIEKLAKARHMLELYEEEEK